MLVFSERFIWFAVLDFVTANASMFIHDVRKLADKGIFEQKAYSFDTIVCHFIKACLPLALFSNVKKESSVFIVIS